MPKSKRNIKQRILDANPIGKRYYDLMLEVFPPDEFPRAFEGSPRGGPPGCAMAFGRALRELGLARNGRDEIYQYR